MINSVHLPAWFASDNAAGAHPHILSAITSLSQTEERLGYGRDHVRRKETKRERKRENGRERGKESIYFKQMRILI